ncbi:MAG: glycosyltransferase family 9 protein [Nitrospira sp.]|nr:glycosyltransferase family 9 protein [Nitrospira sp.]
MRRALVIQLARLGDLIQTIPAIEAIKAADPSLILDLLCPAPLASIGRMVPGITSVLEWDGAAWRRGAQDADTALQLRHVREAEQRIRDLSAERHDRAFVLNQHPRSLLAGALLARDMKSPRLNGPLGERMDPWASYIRDVACTRRSRHVHLADAFCGLCGVRPTGKPPRINVTPCVLPVDIEPIGKQGGPWIGLIVGAGSVERLVPLDVWHRWIEQFLETVPDGRIVLIGQEQERGRYLQDHLPSSMVGRTWNVTGRTTLPELVTILSRCQAVIGSDTGPLHLAAAVGVRVFGWYFARAHVHETGPYGTHHWIWQANEISDEGNSAHDGVRPVRWPIEETLMALTQGKVRPIEGWTVWAGQCDRLGAYYSEAGRCAIPPPEREDLWLRLCPALG